MIVSINFNKINSDSPLAKDIGLLSSNFSQLVPIGKSGIHIKKKNEGKFTEYCGGKVTDAKILQAKHSTNPVIRKRAVFAENARKWAHKHLYGGLMSPKFATYNSLYIPQQSDDTSDEDEEFNISDFISNGRLTDYDNSLVFSSLYQLGDLGAVTTPLINFDWSAQTPLNSTPVQTPTFAVPAIETKADEPRQSVSYANLKGLLLFKAAFDNVARSNKDLAKYEKLFTLLAQLESGFDHKVLNKQGAPAYGYFLFMLDGKKYNNISHYAGVDLNTFRNNPELQINAAYKLAKDFEKSFTAADLKKAKDKGYSINALIAGAWLGGVSGVRKVLNGTGNPSDRYWSSKGYGSSVKEYMDKFKNIV